MSESGVRRPWLEGSLLSAGIGLSLALLLIVNYLGWKYHARQDWTSSELYTLSEKSLDVLESLDRELEVIVFMRPGENLYSQVRELLQRYEAASPRVSLRFVDPDRNPLEVQQLVDRYEVQSIDLVIFDTGADRRVLEGRELAEYDYSGVQYGQGPELTGFKGEQLFTSAIVELLDAKKPKVVFTRGHGELDPDDPSAAGFSQARDLLGKDNFEIEIFPTLGKGAFPEGTDLVVVAGPTEPFEAPEVTLLGEYLEGGGRLLILLDPTLSEDGSVGSLGLDEWLASAGVEIGADLVVDPANPLPFFGAETIFVDAYAEHEITRALDQLRRPVILPLARTVRSGEPPAGAEATELLRTSSEGWGETNLRELDAVGRDEDDLAGPVALGVAVAWSEPTSSGAMPEERDTDDPSPVPAEGARLVVIGDSEFASNAQIASAGNALLLANSFNWLVERETLLGIPPRTPEQVRLNLGWDQLTGIYLLSLLILPGLAVSLGVWVHLRRRR